MPKMDSNLMVAIVAIVAVVAIVFVFAPSVLTPTPTAIPTPTPTSEATPTPEPTSMKLASFEYESPNECFTGLGIGERGFAQSVRIDCGAEYCDISQVDIKLRALSGNPGRLKVVIADTDPHENIPGNTVYSEGFVSISNLQTYNWEEISMNRIAYAPSNTKLWIWVYPEDGKWDADNLAGWRCTQEHLYSDGELVGDMPGWKEFPGESNLFRIWGLAK